MLLAIGLVLLSLGWINRDALYITVLYDFAVAAVVIVDYLISEKASAFRVERRVEDRSISGFFWRLSREHLLLGFS